MFLLLAAPNHPLPHTIHNQGIRDHMLCWRDGPGGYSIYCSCGGPKLKLPEHQGGTKLPFKFREILQSLLAARALNAPGAVNTHGGKLSNTFKKIDTILLKSKDKWGGVHL